MHLLSELKNLKSLRFIILGAIIICTALLFIFFNNLLEDRMYAFKNKLLAMFNEYSGRKISYSSLSPSVLQFFEIRDLVISNKEDNDTALLRIKNLKIRYNLLGLLFSPDPLSAIREINIEHSEFNLDTVKERELADALEKFILERLKQKLDADFSITASDMRFTVAGAEYNVTLSKLFFTVRNDNDIYEYQVRGMLHVDTVERSKTYSWFDSELDFGGKVDKQFTWFDMMVDILSTETNNFTVAEQKFQVTMQDNLLAINKIQDRNPIDLSCEYDLNTEALSLDLISENWKPAYLLWFKKSLKEYNPWLEASIDARVGLEYQIPAKTAQYVLEVRADLNPSQKLPRVSFKANIKGDEKVAVIEPILIDSNGGRMEFRGDLLLANLFPSGKLSFSNIHTGYTGAVTADFEIQREARVFYLKSNNLMLGETGFSAFSLALSPYGREIGFELDSSLARAPLSASIKSKGRLNLSHSVEFDSEWSLVNLPLSEVFGIKAPGQGKTTRKDDNLQNYLINSQFRFQSDFKDFTLVSDEIGLTDNQNRANVLTLDLAMDSGHIQSNKISGKWFGIPLEGDFNVNLAPQGPSDFVTLITLNGIPYTIEGAVIPTQGILISGSYGLDASMLFAEGENIRFWIKTDRMPISINKYTAYISLNWVGFVSEQGDWQLSSMHSKLFNLPVAKEYAPENYLDLSFILTEKELELEEASYYDKISEVKGNGHFTIASFLPFGVSGWCYLENKDAAESYRAEFRLLPDFIDLDLQFANSPLKRLGNFIVNGNLTGNLKVAGSMSKPVIDLNLSLQNGDFHGAALAGDISCTVDEDLFKIHSFQCQYDNNYTIAGGSGEFDKKNGVFQFQAHLAADFLGEAVEADAVFDGSMGPDDYLRLESAFWDTNFNGRLRFYNIFALGDRQQKKNYKQWEFLVNKDATVLNLYGGPENSVAAEIKRDGQFYFDFLSPFPLCGRIEGKIKDPYMDVQADDLRLNLRLLNPLIASKYLVIKSGTAQGNLTISGRVDDPQFFGLLEIKDGSVATAISPDIIKPIDTLMNFQKNELRFAKTKIYMGKAPAEISALLTLKNWLPTQYALNIKTLDTYGLHLAFPVDIVAVDGYFLSPNFRLIGDAMSLKTEGEILVSHCNVTLGNIGSHVAKKDETLYFVDLAIKTGKDVEFTWPSRGVPIIQAIAKQDTDLALHYNGSAQEFSLKGDVALQGGEVFYFNRSFMVKSGIIYLSESEQRFDPVVSLEAERREQLKGKDLKIFLTLKNQYLSQFEPRFRSEPPLASEEILAALGGVFEEKTLTENQSAFNLALNLGSDLLTQFWVLRPFEKAVKDILNVDVFSIRTQIVKNILIDRVFTANTGVAQVNELEGRNFLANTTINLGQYIGNKNDLYFEMLVRFQPADEATTEYENIAGKQNLNVESEFSLELTTPFFLTIKWTITPEHWESFFLPDNKITLKWGFTF